MARVVQEHMATDPRNNEEREQLMRALLPWARTSVEKQADAKVASAKRRKKSPGSHTRKGMPVG